MFYSFKGVLSLLKSWRKKPLFYVLDLKRIESKNMQIYVYDCE